MIGMAADLHIHTTISDGTDAPEQVVNRAISLGLEAIAITDHDNVDGVVPARLEAWGKKIEVIAGVEISCYHNNTEFHILGYFDKPDHPELLELLSEMRQFRVLRANRIIDKLNSLGLSINYDRVKEIAGDGTVGRPHIADALVEKGYIQNREGAFKKYIGKDCPGYVPRKKIKPVEAIELINRTNGVPVLAHPGISGCADLLKEFVASGLKGIEVWHPHHSSLQTQYYLEQARIFRLIPTGGSDYHGERHDSCNSLGAITAPMESVNRIKDLL